MSCLFITSIFLLQAEKFVVIHNLDCHPERSEGSAVDFDRYKSKKQILRTSG